MAKPYGEYDPNQPKPFGKAKALADGKRVRARRAMPASSARRVYQMKPDEVIALIREHVRRACGDWMENNSTIYAYAGVFFVKLPYRRPLNIVTDDYWRKALRDGINLRRHSLGLLFRALRGEQLT